MVYLGEKLAKDYLVNLRKGDVLLWEGFQLKAKRKNSIFVVLTEYNEPNGFFVVRASSSLWALSFYRNGSKEIIWIDQGKEKVLPETTVLDFTRATWILNMQDMVQLCGQGLNRIGRLSEKLIDEIDELVEKTNLIERKWKKQILGARRSEFEE